MRTLIAPVAVALVMCPLIGVAQPVAPDAIVPTKVVSLFNGKVNGDLVNAGFNSTADRGRIALQAEGAEVEFRKVEIGPLPPPAK